MKKEIIQHLYSAFEQAALEVDGVVCWSARDLCTLLGYSQWRNFVGVIDKAKVSCKNVGQSVDDHFADVSKMVPLGSGAEREVDDFGHIVPGTV
jgi:DNA-damage-inducible protein D